MQVLKGRQEDILLAAVNEYIRTGNPVSSVGLFDEYDFGIRPASIRAELSSLENGGWLEQPHTSGGRVPTNKALEFFTTRVRADIGKKAKKEKSVTNLAELMLEGELKNFVRGAAGELHLLSAGVSAGNPLWYTSGIDELFNRIEAHTSRVFYEIARDVECLEERMNELLESGNAPDSPQACIGKKSPLIRNEEVVTIYDIYDINGARVLFATFGPRRMDYRKNLRTFIALREALEL